MKDGKIFHTLFCAVLKALTLGSSFLLFSDLAVAEVESRVFYDDRRDVTLSLEWLDDGLLHFEFVKGQASQTTGLRSKKIYQSPMVKVQEFRGPSKFGEQAETFRTSDLKVQVRHSCFEVSRIDDGVKLSEICAPDFSAAWKTLSVSTKDVEHVYGLGQLFESPGVRVLNRNGKLTTTHGAFGHGMPGYGGGATGEALFPVVTALQNSGEAWALMLDNVYKQSWDLRASDWNIGMFGDHIRGFIISGDSSAMVRQKLMALTGRAPVPPRKMFGFWMSEYGYDDWDEIRSRLVSMRRDGFPIDGFFLDLQWFGNVTPGSDDTPMGTLKFDERHFPDAERVMNSFYHQDDIGFIPIEESYIGKSLDEHQTMESKGFLAHECGSPNRASYLTGDITGNSSEWWGRGGMIDWSNPSAGAFWHDLKRQPLVNLGVFAHWLDLGEPEMFDPKSCYKGLENSKNKHQDIHNVFSLLWAKSVWDGYGRHHNKRRPFLMLRSGNIGLQRFGAGMWSGDIGGNLESLRSHVTSQTHMAWSGIDYYSSDIGGFHRNRVDGFPLTRSETEEAFTKWFANSAWFDVPFRSHVMNLDNDRISAPNAIGHVASNKANLLQRYALVPYYYSLAHKISITGTPLFEPLASAYPKDKRARDIGYEKIIGDLLVVSAAEEGSIATDVYLPKGDWYDRSGRYYPSTGESLSKVALFRDGVYQLPVFARAGALIPKFNTDHITHGVGEGSFKGLSQSMNLEVYVDQNSEEHDFNLVEDDGTTTFEAQRVTTIRQVTQGYSTNIQILGGVGSFDGAQPNRSWTIELWSPRWTLHEVLVNGIRAANCLTPAASDVACIIQNRVGALRIQLPDDDVRLAKNIQVVWESKDFSNPYIAHFVCEGPSKSTKGTSYFISGSSMELGAWDPDRAVQLSPTQFAGNFWSATIEGANTGNDVEWKCLRKVGQGPDLVVEWQSGGNNVQHIPANGGFIGMASSRWGKR